MAEPGRSVEYCERKVIHAIHEHAVRQRTQPRPALEHVDQSSLDQIRGLAENGDDVVVETATDRFFFSFQEVLSRPVLPTRGVSRLSQLRDILQLGQAVFRLPGVISFLVLPQPILENRSAFRLLVRGDFQTVRAALISAYEGMGA